MAQAALGQVDVRSATLAMVQLDVPKLLLRGFLSVLRMRHYSHAKFARFDVNNGTLALQFCSVVVAEPSCFLQLVCRKVYSVAVALDCAQSCLECRQFVTASVDSLV